MLLKWVSRGLGCNPTCAKAAVMAVREAIGEVVHFMKVIVRKTEKGVAMRAWACFILFVNSDNTLWKCFTRSATSALYIRAAENLDLPCIHQWPAQTSIEVMTAIGTSVRGGTGGGHTLTMSLRLHK